MLGLHRFHLVALAPTPTAPHGYTSKPGLAGIPFAPDEQLPYP